MRKRYLDACLDQEVHDVVDRVLVLMNKVVEDEKLGDRVQKSELFYNNETGVFDEDNDLCVVWISKNESFLVHYTDPKPIIRQGRVPSADPNKIVKIYYIDLNAEPEIKSFDLSVDIYDCEDWNEFYDWFNSKIYRNLQHIVNKDGN